MAAASEERLRRDTGCPFCGLACDDLTVARTADRLEITENGCALSRRRYAELQSAAPAALMVDGRPADLAAAVERAADILASSHSPVLVVASDVAGTRAALRLADRIGAVIDHPDSGAQHALRALQDSGALTTTLSEVRNRADFALIVGTDPAAAFPRFYERCIEPRRTLFAEGAPPRALLRLGPPARDAAASPEFLVEELPCAMERLLEAVAALRALLDDRTIAPLDLPGLDARRLAEVVTRLKAARYPLVVWAPAQFDERDGPVLAHALLELARAATRTTRCSLLMLGGSANLLGVNQVCTWQSGYPLRTSFAGGAPEHDPWRYSARRMLASGEADALVWISAFDATRVPPATDAPTILMTSAGAPPPRTAVHVPVGVPGIDHAGQIFRTDGIVAVPLRALRAATLPDVAAVLGLIESRLAARGSAP